jgi:hypothetical protein
VTPAGRGDGAGPRGAQDEGPSLRSTKSLGERRGRAEPPMDPPQGSYILMISIHIFNVYP